MPAKLGINGFGRIGRLALRNIISDPNINAEVVAINDAKPCEYLAYLFVYDSAHGKFECEITHTEDSITINGQTIQVFHTRNPTEIPWGKLGVDIVLECTGQFLTTEKSQTHLDQGAKKVVLSAPAKDKETPTFVVGVNHQDYKAEMNIVSNASCTTNGLASLVKVVHSKFGIESGLMTTIHSATATQRVVDSTSNKDWRKGRSVFGNIIPTTTGAAKALAKVLPEMEGRMTGMSFRVPTANVSVIDLTIRTEKSTSYEEISQAVKEASEGELKGILGYSNEALVSADYSGDTRSSIFDHRAGMGMGDRFFKLVTWYDNEYGYARRLVDMAVHVAEVSGLVEDEEIVEGGQ